MGEEEPPQCVSRVEGERKPPRKNAEVLGMASTQAQPKEGSGKEAREDPEKGEKMQAEKEAVRVSVTPTASNVPVQAVKSHPWWKATHGEYFLAPEWREWALQGLGVPSQKVKVDLFATEGKAARSLYVTKAFDAFSFNWTSLAEQQDDVLWANPPYHECMERVVAKIWQEPCMLALCCPVWPEKPWCPFLQGMVKAQVLLPEERGLYYGVIKKGLLPTPSWRSMVCLVCSKGDRGPYPDPKVSEWVNSRNCGRGLQDLKGALLGGLGPEDPGGKCKAPRGGSWSRRTPAKS